MSRPQPDPDLPDPGRAENDGVNMWPWRIMMAVAILMVVGLVALGIAACGNAPGTGEYNDKWPITERTFTLKNGRIITCVTYNGQGIDCDWGNAR